MMQLLLKHVEDEQLMRDGGVLQCACVAGSVDMVRLLLQHGADVWTAGEGGEEPLTSAAAEGHAEVRGFRD